MPLRKFSGPQRGYGHCVYSLPALELRPPPESTRRRLSALDRLHRIWSIRQSHRPEHGWAEERRQFLRHHCAELHALADDAPGGPELPPAGQLEASLAGPAESARFGQPLDADYIRGLALTLSPPPADPVLPPRAAEALANTATRPIHPVARAALLLRGAARELGSSIHPLPWALASFALIRANYAPLAADRHLAGRYRSALARDTPWDLVELCADAEAVALRCELSWPAPHAEPNTSTALAAVMQNRIAGALRGTAGLDRLPPIPSTGSTATGDPGDWESLLQDAARRALCTSNQEWLWVAVRVPAAERTGRIVFAIQDVGNPPTGVLVVTAAAELEGLRSPADPLELAAADAVTLLPTDTADERWPEVCALIEWVVSRAMAGSRADEWAREGYPS